MNITFIHDKKTLEAFLLKHRELNFYHLGDLDDFFWPYTTWYAAQENGEIKGVNLLYTGTDLPVLLAIENNNLDVMQTVLERTRHLLPRRFYAHLSPGLAEILEDDYTLEHHGEYFKMNLTDPARVKGVDTTGVVLLVENDLTALRELYEVSYPGNWFDPHMLETRQYYGLWEGEVLVSVAGIHVYSEEYRIAALGNITTHPDMRGKGYSSRVTAGLCQNLLKTVQAIGLNVRADNQAAIHVYQKLGFKILTTYHEYMLEQNLD